MRLKGLLIAPAARAWLNDSEVQVRARQGSALSDSEIPQPLSVHSRYQHSVNLVNSAGELLSLVTQELGPGPFALVVRAEAPGFIATGGFEAQLDRDSSVGLDEGRLSIGPLEVDYGRAADWKPQPSWEQVGADKLAANLASLRRLLRQHAPPGSFAPLAEAGAGGALRQREKLADVQPEQKTRPAPEEGGDNASPEVGVAAAALTAAVEPAAELMRGLRARDPAMLGQAAKRLAGLGGGVTPSGDDYLLGAIQALWALAEPADAQLLSEAIVSSAAPRTNRISAAWLKAAGRGEAGNEWHVLAVALASGAPLEEPAAWLIQRGHTSGADALAGFLAAVKVLLA